ncbi:metal ABC transporter solute-binding protein, Zn/Mn family [Puniceibacterium sp. IMCC21224]|uniref:metal ABC transporter solute-binding protein, Zn/Mn family n=1 Tax=Puniceibacterium sp. IMCC21224 TaxID=1618204 RepID=UPI00064E1162|nr:zinc ABC transporter substrate-binding protein [Puniceibacterium sp. IMCC21224]KMK66396.1 ABC-type metal ion transport system, periplasmic component/surface adhesin [Puniceibacterium sp. IMCC21224]
MRLTRRSALASLTATALLPRSALAQQRLNVVATTGMIADAARNIGGAAADVTALMGAGVDPHSYRQTRSDIVALTRSDLALWNGLYLEAQMEEFLLRLAGQKSVVAVGEAVPTDTLLRHAQYQGRVDPHIWMVPQIWRNAVIATRDALKTALPDRAAEFDANGATYLATVDALGAYATRALAQVPAQTRVLVTAHDAFSYFGREYGFEVLGIQGISTQSEAGLQRIGQLVNILVERDIRAVFVETSVSDRNIRALIEGAEARGHKVEIGGELYSDAMGEPGTYEGTYEGMIDHNVTVIARALGADIPPAGMSGKLASGA